MDGQGEPLECDIILNIEGIPIILMDETCGLRGWDHVEGLIADCWILEGCWVYNLGGVGWEYGWVDWLAEIAHEWDGAQLGLRWG